jgi:hypothetical protein
MKSRTVELGAILLLAAASVLVAADSSSSMRSDPARVVFDLPETVECRDVTPQDFAQAHPALKVIEARFRISARMASGSESDIVDFLYIIASPDKQMRFQDYLPNTSLESTVADDEIEITDTTENVKAGEIGARVGYQAVGGGLSRTKSTKKSHTSRYKEIAPRALVVASGTTDHEHGVFFRLKPSRAASLEGAKEFTFLATVPKSWRGGWCTISCAARANSRTFFSRSKVVPAGAAQSQVGLYLLGDPEANRLAGELGAVQQLHADVLSAQLPQDALLRTMHEAAANGTTASLCGVFKITPASRESDSPPKALDEARHAISHAQERLRRLSE